MNRKRRWFKVRAQSKTYVNPATIDKACKYRSRGWLRSKPTVDAAVSISVSTVRDREQSFSLPVPQSTPTYPQHPSVQRAKRRRMFRVKVGGAPGEGDDEYLSLNWSMRTIRPRLTPLSSLIDRAPDSWHPLSNPTGCRIEHEARDQRCNE